MEIKEVIKQITDKLIENLNVDKEVSHIERIIQSKEYLVVQFRLIIKGDELSDGLSLDLVGKLIDNYNTLLQSKILDKKLKAMHIKLLEVSPSYNYAHFNVAILLERGE